MADIHEVALGALDKVQLHHRSIGWEPRRQSGKNLPAAADPDRARSSSSALGLAVTPASSFASLSIGADLETSIWMIA
jgi:hypothetical protein